MRTVNRFVPALALTCALGGFGAATSHAMELDPSTRVLQTGLEERLAELDEAAERGALSKRERRVRRNLRQAVKKLDKAADKRFDKRVHAIRKIVARLLGSVWDDTDMVHVLSGAGAMLSEDVDDWLLFLRAGVVEQTDLPADRRDRALAGLDAMRQEIADVQPTGTQGTAGKSKVPKDHVVRNLFKPLDVRTDVRTRRAMRMINYGSNDSSLGCPATALAPTESVTVAVEIDGADTGIEIPADGATVEVIEQGDARVMRCTLAVCNDGSPAVYYFRIDLLADAGGNFFRGPIDVDGSPAALARLFITREFGGQDLGELPPPMPRTGTARARAPDPDDGTHFLLDIKYDDAFVAYVVTAKLELPEQ